MIEYRSQTPNGCVLSWNHLLDRYIRGDTETLNHGHYIASLTFFYFFDIEYLASLYIFVYSLILLYYTCLIARKYNLSHH